jgi:hypothetical protein
VGTPGSDNQVFIVRIRIVPREMPGKAPIWRGEIEQLSSSRKAFLKNLNEIISFIQPVLEEMGVEETGPPAALSKWLKAVIGFITSILRGRKS